MRTEDRSLVETPPLQNSIETHRNNKGEWSTNAKIYFSNSQEDAEAALEWLADLNLRLLFSYPPVDVVQSEILTRHLEMSLIAARERNGNS